MEPRQRGKDIVRVPAPPVTTSFESDEGRPSILLTSMQHPRVLRVFGTRARVSAAIAPLDVHRREGDGGPVRIQGGWAHPTCVVLRLRLVGMASGDALHAFG